MPADLLITNARIYTVDPARPWAEAVAARDGRILAVGRDAEVRTLAGPGTRMIDAGGRLVLPGLTDAHVHFLGYATRRHQVSLFGLTDIGEVLSRVRVAAEAAPPGAWIVGWGWDDNRWDTRPTAALLDEVAPGHPVMLARMDMHTWWVSSAVLARAGITAETPDPPEGAIGRDADGQPNGLLSEWSALALIEPYIPQPDEDTLARWLLEAQTEAHRLGLTGLQDQRIEREGRETWRLLQRLRREGTLTLRVQTNLAADFVPEAAALGLQAGFGDDRLWIGHAKAFADGTMGSRTAHMLAPFEGEPGNTGVVVTPAGELYQLITAAGEAGFPLSVHAIGDRAVREVLDVMGEWTATHGSRISLPMPHRIEHVQVAHPDDLPRLAPLGVVASVQPVHLMTDWRTADRVWGGRARTAYAFRTLLDCGTALALGSDAPVAPLDPLLGIYAAVTRQDAGGEPAGGWYPEQRLTVAEAIHGYTMGPAHVSGKADRLGSITPGKYADFTILSRNLFDIPTEEIPTAKPSMTIAGGQVVYAD